MSEIWQTVSYLESSSGNHQIGLCTQNVLWSDANVFSTNSEAAGNTLMYAVTEYAQKLIKGQTFKDPVSLLDDTYPRSMLMLKKSPLTLTLEKLSPLML